MKKSIGTLLLPCLVALATVFSASAARAAYWNLFNIEGESAISAEFVTYATLADMLNDENRLGAFVPDGAFIGRNIVGSGSDGSTYWNLFNIEGESAISAEFITYATLADMLNDENRLGAFVPDGAFIGRNIVGSGADILSRPPGAVPEPSVISMLAGALAMLALRRRRWPRSLA